MSIPFVGKRFTPEQFRVYLDALELPDWTPSFVTLHHCAEPSLAQRPNGFTDQHLENLLDYYENQLGWHGAPHLFIDDRPDGIIVFQELSKRGVHAKSFNANSWGVEMLGDYDSEDPTSGRGAAVLNNAVRAVAMMNDRLGVGPETLKFHRDDPLTNKTCPGTKIAKGPVVSAVSRFMRQGWKEADSTPPKTPSGPSPWAKEAADWAIAEGLIKDGRWQDNITREELAIVLMRLAKKGQGV